MLPLGRTRYIDFAIADVNSNPVPGRTLAEWSASPNRLIFLRNMVPCTDPLALHDYGDGRYTVSYSPTAAGHDFLQIYDQVTDIKITDVEDIVPADFAVGGGPVFVLDENFGGAGKLKVTAANPDTYVLQVYASTSWEQGMRSDAYSVGTTVLRSDGTWAHSISVPSGTYHVVITKFRNQQIIKAYLGVG
jgi:hypothetical protein